MVAPVRRRGDFDALGSTRARGRSGPVRVAWAAGPDDDPAPVRVAYAVARTAGPAVVRNRIRRRLRPMIADLDAAGALAPGAYLVAARAECATLPAPDLRRHLAAAVAGATRGRSA